MCSKDALYITVQLLRIDKEILYIIRNLYKSLIFLENSFCYLKINKLAKDYRKKSLCRFLRKHVYVHSFNKISTRGYEIMTRAHFVAPGLGSTQLLIFQDEFTNETLQKPICRWFSMTSIAISTRTSFGESVMATQDTNNDVKKQHQLWSWHFTRFAQSVMLGGLSLAKSEQRLSVVGNLRTCHTSSIANANTAT